MIKSDYYLVKNSIENNDDILSIVDINGNYYKRYSNYPLVNNAPSYMINNISYESGWISASVRNHINCRTICTSNDNLVVIMLREKPRTFHHHIYKIKNSILTYENNESWYQN